MPTITFQCRPALDNEREFTAEQLRAHTEQAIGMKVFHQPFGIVASDNETMMGSVVGKIFFNWLHIDLIWVAENYRKQGVGKELMKLTAKQAKTMGLNGIEVWTQSWQAPEFYRKLGYDEFAVIDDFTPGRKRHAFRLKLGTS